MDIKVEMFFVTLDRDNVLFLKKVSGLPEYELNPSKYVEKLVSKLEDLGYFTIKGKVINHSTSWRYNDSSIILSFLVYSDFFRTKPKDYIPFSELKMKRSVSYLNPEPKGLNDTNVLSHALKHFNFLLKENKDNYEKIVLPETIDKLKFITKNY